MRGLMDNVVNFLYGLYYYRDDVPYKMPPVQEPYMMGSAVSLAEKIRNREVTSEEVVRAYCARIDSVNELVNAVVDRRYAEAVEEARGVDTILATGALSADELKNKPFLGVPFTTKESNQCRGMKHTVGLVFRKDIRAIEDADVIRLMKEAGAILIATTNVPVLCLWIETGNKVYGQTNNPYNLTRNAGGSSGGEAAIIAAAGSPVGIGGSIRLPAFFCGIFGHKPYSTDLASSQAGGSSGGEAAIIAAAGSPVGIGTDIGGSIRLPAFFYGIFGHKPYSTDHDSHQAGGSSGGEAAIIAAAGSPVGIGTDIGGSIRLPAFFCGIFGHKPYSTDLVSSQAGGSSGGEAAIIAAAGSPVGIGTDIGGSIRLPAFFCGIFGHKPYSTDLVSSQAGGSSGGEAAIIAAAGSPVGIGTDIGGSIRLPAFFCGIFGHKPYSTDLASSQAGGSSGGEAAIIAAAGSPVGIGTDIGGSIRLPAYFCGIFGHKPYSTDLASSQAGGSSGGEAAIIAAAGSPVGIGTDIGGSIRLPAFFCGIFGHKPTTGLTPLKGVTLKTGEDGSMSCAGPMSRYAEDLAPILKVIVGENVAKLPKLDDEVSLEDLRVFFMPESCDVTTSPMSSDLRSAMDRVVVHMSTRSRHPVKKLDLENMKHSYRLWVYKLMKDQEDKPPLAEVLTDMKGKVSFWPELFKLATKQSELTLACLVVMRELEMAARENEEWAKEKIESLQKEVAEILGDNGVLIYPSFSLPASYHNTSYFWYRNLGYTSIFNLLRLPATQVPLGLNESGLPVGVQVVAGPYQDHLCIAVAKELERAFGGWVPPFKT